MCGLGFNNNSMEGAILGVPFGPVQSSNSDPVFGTLMNIFLAEFQILTLFKQKVSGSQVMLTTPRC